DDDSADGRKRPFRRPDAKLRPFKRPLGTSGAPKPPVRLPGRRRNRPENREFLALTGAETMEFGPENGGHLPTVGDGGVWGSGRRFRRRAKTAVPMSGRAVTANSTLPERRPRP